MWYKDKIEFMFLLFMFDCQNRDCHETITAKKSCEILPEDFIHLF